MLLRVFVFFNKLEVDFCAKSVLNCFLPELDDSRSVKNFLVLLVNLLKEIVGSHYHVHNWLHNVVLNELCLFLLKVLACLRYLAFNHLLNTVYHNQLKLISVQFYGIDCNSHKESFRIPVRLALYFAKALLTFWIVFHDVDDALSASDGV